jgi:hypothetical protein
MLKNLVGNNQIPCNIYEQYMLTGYAQTPATLIN